MEHGLDLVRHVNLPRIMDDRGNLSFIESGIHVPFAIERVYWVYDVPGGETRGGHAYRTLDELVVALSGSFDVVLNDGVREQRYHLNRSYNALYVPRMIWRSLENFSTNSFAFIAASGPYDPNDYIRDIDQFRSHVAR